jgi:mannose-6-phosphate isomerase-like protein (cupin superfamily)
MNLKKLLPLLVLPALYAAAPEGLMVWKSQDLKAYKKAQSLADYGNHTVQVNHREVNGEMEVHQNWNDFMIVQTGEAKLLIGGTVVNPKTTAPGEIRGSTSTGGEMKTLGPGDIVHIPANLPHQFLVAPGQQITYVAAKIPAKNPNAPADLKDFVLWKAQELKAFEKSLSPKVNENHVSAQALTDFGNHKTQMTHREGTGEVAAHQDWVDLFEVVSGEATLLAGGAMTNAKTTGPGETRGPSMEGGEKKALGPGDVLHIPAGMPHQFLVPSGKQITYFEMKVPAK